MMMVACQSESAAFLATAVPDASENDPMITETPVPRIVQPEIQNAPATPTAPAVALTGASAAPVDDADEISQVADDPEETVRPIPEGLIGPDTFPPNVNPLTGETVSDPSVLARRPVAIKISNAPAVVRPQAGLNDADLVFEHYAEGGLTRFTAVFYSKDVDPIGSIRSGRLVDIEIPQMYDAAFAYSGSSGPLQLMFRNGSFFDRVVSPDFGHGGFFRIEDPGKAFEHTLFTSTHNLRSILDARGQNTAPSLPTNMAFSPTPLSFDESVSKIEIQYDATNVTWVYNPGRGSYVRWTDGIAHADANTGEQLQFKNVVAVGAHHVDTDILEDNVAGGHYSIQIQVWGEGPVSVFRDGKRIEGRWQRQDPSHMLTFYDLQGNILPLALGNSFFQLVPLGFDRMYTTP
jgi:hypothetical protein